MGQADPTQNGHGGTVSGLAGRSFKDGGYDRGAGFLVVREHEGRAPEARPELGGEQM